MEGVGMEYSYIICFGQTPLGIPVMRRSTWRGWSPEKGDWECSPNCLSTSSHPAAMHSDPSKKASIDSLLNPQLDSPYSLRAAFDWDTTSKHADHPPWPRSMYSDERTGTNLSTHAPSPPLTSLPSVLPGDYPSSVSPTLDRDPYALIHPASYSDSVRSSPIESTAWQTAERASVRLAARGTVSHNSLGPSHQQSQHDARYCATGSSVSSAIHSVGPHCPQNHSQYQFQSPYALQLNQSAPYPETHSFGQPSLQQSREPASCSQPLPDTVSDPEGSNSTSRKRSRPVSEGLAEPQSKRVKGKVKSTTEATTTSTGTKTLLLPLFSFVKSSSSIFQVLSGAATNGVGLRSNKVCISVSRSAPPHARYSMTSVA
jgi:lysine-specific demethylase 3